MTGEDVFPYPDDDPETIRGMARSLGSAAERLAEARRAVEDGRGSLSARWRTPAGAQAMGEIDAVGGLGDEASTAVGDGEAPLTTYAGVLDEARSTIDGLRTQYDAADADHQAALESLEGSELTGPGLSVARQDALDARTARQGALHARYAEVQSTVRTAAATAGAALAAIAGRISPSPGRVDGAVVRARIVDRLPMLRDIHALAERYRIDHDTAALVALARAGHPVTGDVAGAVLLAEFGRFDTAHEGGDPDGKVSADDLRAVADDPSMPPEVRAAARYLLDNPTLRALIDVGDDAGGRQDADDRITTADVAAFLTTNRHLRHLYPVLDRLDTARHGGSPDGYISRNDLEAAANDRRLPASAREAARYILDHDPAFQSVGEQWNDRGSDGLFGEASGLTVNDFIGRLVDGQAYVHDPRAAMDFTVGLPVATDGGEGLPLGLTSDDGTKALANSALVGADGDLTDSQRVIAHLPETTTAVRNELITSYYDMLARRADAIFAGAHGAVPGNLASPGHPGANWLHFGPWASNGVHDAITGDELPMMPMSIRQAAADGNQWIFNDLTQPFAAFVELYERTGGEPSTAELQGFFDDSFDDGQAEMRRGFQSYVAALDEDDPARRQQLMFQGNALIAIHEQAGAEPYLDRVAGGPWIPDGLATEFVGLDIAGRHVDVNEDVPATADGPGGPNLVDDAPILDLDPSRLSNADLSTGDVRFSTGGTPGEGTVVLRDIEGWDDRSDLALSSREWYQQEGSVTEYHVVGEHVVPEEVHPDPDQSLAGTRAESWPDYEDRMWFIHRLFEQNHTRQALTRTRRIHEDLDVDAWLSDDVPLALGR